ncbi:MAG TPA: preprotein translocase subunit YajC [Fimbriiglobus sp.]|nr:preprotein translocase subunit YajC [Fimbriiglobus sp.]
MTAYTLIAEDPAPPKQDAGLIGSPAFPFLLLALFALFWVVVVLPQSRRAKREQQHMLAGIKPGSRIVTSAGIVGKVVKAKDGEDEITMQSEDAKLRVLRSSVLRVLGDEPAESK